MFTIFGGATAFTQWQKDQKVINPDMKAGDPVYFAAGSGVSYPTRAYISGGDIVADVPNELLTVPKPFTVRLNNYPDYAEPVTIFSVEAADKPSGYVYEDNMSKPRVPGDVVIPAGATLTLEEGAKVQDKNGLLPSTPEAKVILPGTEFAFNGDSFSLTTPPPAYPEVGKTYVVTFNGQEYVLPVIYEEESGAYMFFGTDGGSVIIFTCVFVPAELATQYGAYVGVDTAAETCTLSIVEKPAAVGGGSFVVNATAVGEYDPQYGGLMAMELSMDKPLAEAIDAFRSGAYVAVNMAGLMEGAAVRIPAVSCEAGGLIFNIFFDYAYYCVYWDADVVWFELVTD